jgi:hypothetical protein
MLNRRTIVTFTVGLVLGALIVILAKPILGTRLPEAVGGRRESLEGFITAKQRDDDRLLLTISTPAGAMLATFTKRVPEIALLVETGDSITVTLAGYQPFLQDPQIIRVAKPVAYPEGQSQEPDSAETVSDTLTQTDTIPADSTAPWY